MTALSADEPLAPVPQAGTLDSWAWIARARAAARQATAPPETPPTAPTAPTAEPRAPEPD